MIGIHKTLCIHKHIFQGGLCGHRQETHGTGIFKS